MTPALVDVEPFRVGDMFCGAGGTCEGLRLALKDFAKLYGTLAAEVFALNHWRTAVDTHEANHPGVVHKCADAFPLDPHALVPGGELDLLMASPTCTFFSRARGGKPISWDQRKGRMTPKVVEKWCRELEVRVLLVENVPEFQHWGPVCQSRGPCDKHGWAGPEEGKRAICGKPNPDKRGTLFRAWVKRLERRGYVVSWRILNAANYGDATTRERFFLIARRDGVPIEWPAATHSREGSAGGDLFAPSTQRWVSARDGAIDWTLRGASIFARPKPLAAKTLLRILAGIVRFGWPETYVLKLWRYMVGLGIEIPEEVVTRDGRSLVAPVPLVLNRHGDNGAVRAHPVDEPLPTATCRGAGYVVEPAVVVLRQHADLRSAGDPLPAVMAAGTHLGLVEPLVMRADCQGGNGHNTRGASEPVYTPTTNGGLALIVPQRNDAPARSADAPVPTVVAVARVGLVEPFTFPLNQGLERVRGLKPTSEPLGTITATGTDLGLVAPFVLSQGAGGAPRSVEDPVPSIPTEGAHALLAPYYSSSECSSVENPLGTITTRDQYGLVTPVTHNDSSNRSRSVDAPLPTVTGAARGELAFVVGAFGERPGQAPRTLSVEEPVPTILAKGRVPLVQGDEKLDEVDILFRMLEPPLPRERSELVKTTRTYDFKWRRKQAEAFADAIGWQPGWLCERIAGPNRRCPLTREQMDWLRGVLEHEAERLIEKAAARERKRLREGKVIRQRRAAR